MGQGKENVKMYLKENPQIKEEIDRKLREKLGISDGDVEETEDAPKSLFGRRIVHKFISIVKLSKYPYRID